MSIAQKDQELKALYHKFGVPEFVKKWIENSDESDDIPQYNLHAPLCNMHPEDALLCIALCLKVIHQKHIHASKLLENVVEIMDSIVENYGASALNRDTKNFPDIERIDIEFVAADLDMLTYHLENIEPYLFENQDDSVSIIIHALYIQAKAQAEIASYVLKNFREQSHHNKTFKQQDVPFLKTLPVNDNKIKI